MKEPKVLCNFKDICSGEAELIPSGKFGASDPLVQRECSNCGCGEVTYVPGGNLVYCPNCGKRYVNSDRKNNGVVFARFVPGKDGINVERFRADASSLFEITDVFVVKPGEACVIQERGKVTIWKNLG